MIYTEMIIMDEIDWWRFNNSVSPGVLADDG